MNIGQSGTLAKVTAIDQQLVCVQLQNGNSATITNPSEPCQVGDILHLSENDGIGNMVKWPKETWREETWVGTVVLKLNDLTVVDQGYRLKAIETTNQIDYAEGNTVLVGDTKGITRLVHPTPLRNTERYTTLSTPSDKFLWKPDETETLDFEHFGGLANVVNRARELIELPLNHHCKLSEIGARPIKGVLFTGPPGTGKTMLARIIAYQSGAPLYSISGPEIFSKWYGESEHILREIFAAATSEDKAIIFLDEIDSVAAQRDNNSHEASKRVVAQLLTLMDGFKKSSNVIVIATTNRPDDLDVALRRPGRFDWEIHFPYPNAVDRVDILQKTSDMLVTIEPLPHTLIAAKTEGWSGAELTAIWSEAAILAVADERDAINQEDYYGGFERVAQYRTHNNLPN